jgi:polyphenol oxidase
MAAKFLKPFRFGNNVLAFVSTKQAGNIGYHVRDDQKKVTANRKALSASLKIPVDSFTCAVQVHGGRIAKVTGRMKGKGALNLRSAIKDADGMVTNIPGICLLIQVADCVPLLFYDPKKKVIGATHAGWRGTVKDIAGKTVKAMNRHFGSSPKDIYVSVAPSIGKCCYEVGPEVAKEFGYMGRMFLDLKKENLKQLINAGISRKNIQISPICTKCSSKDFFSVRAAKGNTGRFGAGILLKDLH